MRTDTAGKRALDMELAGLRVAPVIPYLKKIKMRRAGLPELRITN